MRKKQAGDTKEMVQARRSFLERGFYQPLADTLNTLVSAYLREHASPINVLDAGCGEGYYLGRLQQSLSQQEQLCLLGLDVAKDAIRMAAKRYPCASFVVANLKERLVIADESIHVLLNIFAPRNPAEFARVMMPAGRLIVVIPGAEHMAQLRSTLPLLQIEENKQQHIVEQFAPYFTLLEAVPVSYELDLKREEVQQLVMMTPNYWHLSDEARRAMSTIQSLRTQVAFICLAFQKSVEG
ncbi:methyltransferase domain-containing protein [Reticulibacter mediterranei]|uniref:methyltransferase domain-containing protein n=1 Tax=Reticulibacter mediterranei TaxID=2778369 RepID=UPI001C6901B7|nr:methyltransferase domain-containing protein [Reticulibacter mediterranei]